MGVTDFYKTYFCNQISKKLIKLNGLPKHIYVDFNIYWISKQQIRNFNMNHDEYHKHMCAFFINSVFEKEFAYLKSNPHPTEPINVTFVIDSKTNRHLLKINKCFNRMRASQNTNIIHLNFNFIEELFNKMCDDSLCKNFEFKFVIADVDADEHIHKSIKNLTCDSDTDNTKTAQTIDVECEGLARCVQRVEIGNIFVYTNDSDYAAFFPICEHVCILTVDNGVHILKNFEINYQNDIINSISLHANTIVDAYSKLDKVSINVARLFETYFKTLASVSVNDYSTACFLKPDIFRLTICDKNIYTLTANKFYYNKYDVDFYFTYWSYYISNAFVYNKIGFKTLINNALRPLNIISVPMDKNYKSMIVGIFKLESFETAEKRKNPTHSDMYMKKMKLTDAHQSVVHIQNSKQCDEEVTSDIFIKSVAELTTKLSDMLAIYLEDAGAVEHLKSNYKNIYASKIKTLWVWEALNIYYNGLKVRSKNEALDPIIAATVLMYIILNFKAWFLPLKNFEQRQSFKKMIISLENAFSLQMNVIWLRLKDGVLRFILTQ